MKLTPEQQAKALAFDRENWRRWGAKEITTDEACANLDRYMAAIEAGCEPPSHPTSLTEQS